MTTSQGTPSSGSLPMKANGRSGLKIVVSWPIRRARPRTAVSEPSVTMNGGSSQKRDQRAVDQAEHQPDQRAPPGCRASPSRGSFEARSAVIADGGEDRADRQVDAAGQDDEGHARREHDVDRGLLRHDRDVLQAEERPSVTTAETRCRAGSARAACRRPAISAACDPGRCATAAEAASPPRARLLRGLMRPPVCVHGLVLACSGSPAPAAYGGDVLLRVPGVGLPV